MAKCCVCGTGGAKDKPFIKGKHKSKAFCFNCLSQWHSNGNIWHIERGEMPNLPWNATEQEKAKWK